MTDTLKQAAQARLSGYAIDTVRADANEAFKKHFASLHKDRFSDPLYEPSRLAFVAGFLVARETALSSAPIATPEHDAQVRNAALEAAIQICWQKMLTADAIPEIRALKTTGGDHAE